MKMNFKKIISLIVCICFICSFCMSSVVCAAANEAVGENNVQVVRNDDKFCTVVGTYKGNKLYATLDKSTNEITMQAVEKAKIFGIPFGKEKTTGLKVEVETLTKNEVSAFITDTKTGKEYKVNKNTDKVKAQAVVIIPLSNILTAAVLAALAAAAAIIIVNGITYYDLTTFMDKIKEYTYKYYAAVLVDNDDVYIGGGLSESDAIKRMKNIGNVFARSEYYAVKICTTVGGGLSPAGPHLHSGQGRYYWHYHPSYSSSYSNAHCFFK